MRYALSKPQSVRTHEYGMLRVEPNWVGQLNIQGPKYYIVGDVRSMGYN